MSKSVRAFSLGLEGVRFCFWPVSCATPLSGLRGSLFSDYVVLDRSSSV